MTKRDGVSFLLGNHYDPSSLVTQSFSVHGLTLRIASNSRFIHDSILNLLGYFRHDHEIGEAEIQFFLIHSAISELGFLPWIRSEGELLFDSRDGRSDLSREAGIDLNYYIWKEFFIADFLSKGILLFDPLESIAVGIIPDPESIQTRILSNFIFSIGFSEMVRSKGLFPIHAAALAREGKGILIPGLTGSGKTTLCVALLRKGFRFLSDDRPFIRRGTRGFKLLAFPEPVGVTDQTLSFFPELRNLPGHVLRKDRRKRDFRVENVYPNSILNDCIPHIVLFPRIVDQEASKTVPLSKTETLENLLPHTLLVFDRGLAKKQFHLLCELVEGMDGYTFEFGRDFLEVHKLVEDLL